MTYIDTARKKKNGKVYERHLLRRAYREGGKIMRETVANISSCTLGEIAAIKLALRYKHDLSALCSIKDTVSLGLGKSVGAVYVLYQMAKRLGIEAALGGTNEGKLALWQVISRAINKACIVAGYIESDKQEFASWCSTIGWRACVQRDTWIIRL